MGRRVTARRPRVAGALGTAVLMAATVAGCGSSGGSGASAAAFDPTDTSIKAEINWVGWAPDVSKAPEYIAAFNKVYPNIKVDFKVVQYTDYAAALRPALVSGAGPDVFDLQPGVITQQYGQFGEDLSTVAEQVLPDWKNKISPIGISGLQYQGKQVSLPIGSGAAGQIWYNNDLFAKYGLTAPHTLDQWVQTCATFKAHGVTCFVQGAKDEWVDQDTVQAIADSYAPGKFAEAVAGKLPWTDPDLVSAFNTWQALFHDGIMQPGASGMSQYPDANNTWLAGKAAMIMMGSWDLQMVSRSNITPQIKAAGSNAAPFVALPMAFPDVAGRGNTVPLYGDADYGLAVNKNSKNKAAAEAFATWLALTTAGQQFVADQLADTPSLKGISAQLSDLVDPSSQTAAVSSTTTATQNVTEHRDIPYADLVTALGDALSAIATGQQSTSAALAALQSASSQISR